jgi:hypothetical protein
MAAFKKTLETWYKETHPDKNLVKDLKDGNVASTIIAAYIADDSAVEYTTEYGKGVSVYSLDPLPNALKNNITFDTMEMEQLKAREWFEYSCVPIDLGEIQRKLQITLSRVCNQTNLVSRQKLEQIRKLLAESK